MKSYTSKKNIRKYFIFFGLFLFLLFVCGHSFVRLNVLNACEVSVIIPVYNVAKYLPECIESVCGQTLEKIEIIFVDDGSTDNSLEILKKYQENEKKIIIIEQENTGVSAARNSGIKKATGNYVAFLDADDYLEKNTYELCLAKAKETDADIVAFDWIGEPTDFCVHKSMESKVFVNDSFSAIDIDLVSSAVWDKLYKRSLIIENNIFFKEDVKYAEDNLFNYMIFPHAKKIATFPRKLYHYRLRETSVDQTMSSQKRLENAVLCAKYLSQDWLSKNYKDKNLWLVKYILRITYDRIVALENSELKNKYANQILCVLNDVVK